METDVTLSCGDVSKQNSCVIYWRNEPYVQITLSSTPQDASFLKPIIVVCMIISLLKNALLMKKKII